MFRMHWKERKLLQVLALPLLIGGYIMLTVSIELAFLTVGLFWVAPAWAAAEIAMRKDRGAWWGLFLGWIGVIIAAALGPGRSHEMNELERRATELQILELEQRLAASGEEQKLTP